MVIFLEKVTNRKVVHVYYGYELGTATNDDHCFELLFLSFIIFYYFLILNLYFAFA